MKSTQEINTSTEHNILYVPTSNAGQPGLAEIFIRSFKTGHYDHDHSKITCKSFYDTLKPLVFQCKEEVLTGIDFKDLLTEVNIFFKKKLKLLTPESLLAVRLNAFFSIYPQYFDHLSLAPQLKLTLIDPWQNELKNNSQQIYGLLTEDYSNRETCDLPTLINASLSAIDVKRLNVDDPKILIACKLLDFYITHLTVDQIELYLLRLLNLMYCDILYYHNIKNIAERCMKKALAHVSQEKQQHVIEKIINEFKNVTYILPTLAVLDSYVSKEQAERILTYALPDKVPVKLLIPFKAAMNENLKNIVKEKLQSLETQIEEDKQNTELIKKYFSYLILFPEYTCAKINDYKNKLFECLIKEFYVSYRNDIEGCYSSTYDKPYVNKAQKPAENFLRYAEFIDQEQKYKLIATLLSQLPDNSINPHYKYLRLCLQLITLESFFPKENFDPLSYPLFNDKAQYSNFNAGECNIIPGEIDIKKKKKFIIEIVKSFVSNCDEKLYFYIYDTSNRFKKYFYQDRADAIQALVASQYFLDAKSANQILPVLSQALAKSTPCNHHHASEAYLSWVNDLKLDESTHLMHQLKHASQSGATPQVDYCLAFLVTHHHLKSQLDSLTMLQKAEKLSVNTAILTRKYPTENQMKEVTFATLKLQSIFRKNIAVKEFKKQKKIIRSIYTTIEAGKEFKKTFNQQLKKISDSPDLKSTYQEYTSAAKLFKTLEAYANIPPLTDLENYRLKYFRK